jgi:hypothetical protein
VQPTCCAGSRIESVRYSAAGVASPLSSVSLQHSGESACRPHFSHFAQSSLQQASLPASWPQAEHISLPWSSADTAQHNRESACNPHFSHKVHSSVQHSALPFSCPQVPHKTFATVVGVNSTSPTGDCDSELHPTETTKSIDANSEVTNFNIFFFPTRISVYPCAIPRHRCVGDLTSLYCDT